MSIKSKRLIGAVLANAALFSGTDYSREKRDRIWPGGSMDCSSFMAAIWSAAGYPLLDALGNELRTSCYQVHATGFDMLYPETKAAIGKALPSPKGLLASIAQPGDLVFWNFDRDTGRKNKITHVGSVDMDGEQIIHTANNREKCCNKPLSYGDGSICAILRLRDDFVYPALPEIRRPTENSGRADAWMVRMLQGALNMKYGEQLELDGIFGRKTEEAVQDFNEALGMPGGSCAEDTWAALGFANGCETRNPPPRAEEAGPAILRIASPLLGGQHIQHLQHGLNGLGYACGTADGICGERTLAGVRAFARAHREV